MDPPAVDLVLLDAFGTLIEMEPPAPILRASLADAGYPYDEDAVTAALATEIAHYRARMHIGGDPAGLAELRAECGAVLARALGPGAPGPDLATELLVDALRFRLYDDARVLMDVLDDMAIPMGVVSNWDCALPEHLARLGVAHRFRVIAASAAVGYAKPDARIFQHALAATGVAPARALHVGDRPVEDVEGAHGAGVPALLIDRVAGHHAAAGVITSLTDIPLVIAA